MFGIGRVGRGILIHARPLCSKPLRCTENGLTLHVPPLILWRYAKRFDDAAARLPIETGAPRAKRRRDRSLGAGARMVAHPFRRPPPRRRRRVARLLAARGALPRAAARRVRD